MGSSRPPAGSRSRTPMKAPPRATSKVAARPVQLAGGSSSPWAAGARCGSVPPFLPTHQCADQRGREGHAHHAQVLHEGHQPHVRAVRLGHDHHRRGAARCGAPDRGVAGEHVPARKQPAQRVGQDGDGEHAGEKRRPVRQQGRADGGRHAARDQAADHALRGDEGGCRAGARRGRRPPARWPPPSGPSRRPAGRPMASNSVASRRDSASRMAQRICCRVGVKGMRADGGWQRRLSGQSAARRDAAPAARPRPGRTRALAIIFG